MRAEELNATGLNMANKLRLFDYKPVAAGQDERDRAVQGLYKRLVESPKPSCNTWVQSGDMFIYAEKTTRADGTVHITIKDTILRTDAVFDNAGNILF